MLTVNTDAVNSKPEEYLITDDNRILELGDYCLMLPAGFYRMPFTPRYGSDEFISGSFNGSMTSSFYFRRIDLRDTDDIIYKVWAQAHGDDACVGCFESKYRKEIIQVHEGEVKEGEGSFDFETGNLDFIRSVKTFDNQILKRYQCMYYPDGGDWQKCSLYSEHLVLWKAQTKISINEYQGLSTSLLAIFKTVHGIAEKTEL